LKPRQKKINVTAETNAQEHAQAIKADAAAVMADAAK